ncbi:hypothetical protein SAMN02745704_01691 [Paucidesulfovibrio gracilis DSM 16080]|uniref:Uncharacterized protein n=1 Tax=Paucidesulfovibrio gracilis DSM 16080 TaxID=1121449 RepID=A0A1T4X2I0_9BACT|nr:hypothetical protein SAMN02745704_01691 [Paucidesulfovibrio gracilis DSM 16080]
MLGLVQHGDPAPGLTDAVFVTIIPRPGKGSGFEAFPGMAETGRDGRSLLRGGTERAGRSGLKRSCAQGRPINPPTNGTSHEF